MLTRFECPICRMALEAEADVSGTQVLCPGCNTVIAVPAKELLPGTVIGGFQIKSLLGKGGMGEVYLAHQLSMGRDIALKILPPGLAEGVDDRARFLNEVRMTARLEHPNIVPAYEAGEDGGIMYLAMAYIKGDSLETRLANHQPLAQKEALVITRKIAAALNHAWREHRVLHRDVKPANIMVDPYGEPRLMDMGLSKSVREKQGMTQTGHLIGTPNYMSPEHLQGQELDFRTDMYALGATLYHLLTGRMPFLASSVIQTLRKQVSQPLPDPRTLNSHVTEACVLLMERMMAKKPKNRYASWDEVIADIQIVLSNGRLSRPGLPSGASVLQRNVPATQRVPAARKKPAEGGTPTIVWIAVAGGVVLMVLGVMVAVKQPAARPPRVVAAIPTAPAVMPVAPRPIAAPLPPVPRPAAPLVPVKPAPAPVANPAPAPETAADDWAKAQEKVTQDVLSTLKDKADKLEAQGMHDAALAVLLEYKGPFANETAAQRKAMAKPFQELVAAKQQSAARLAEAKTNWNLLADALAGDLRKGDLARAGRRVQDAYRDERLQPLQADLKALDDALRATTAAHDRILQSFEKDIGKEITVQFVDGKAAVTVDAVAPPEISGRKQLEGGFIGCKFGLADLAVAEKNQRLGYGKSGACEIARGLVDAEAGENERAMVHFRTAGGPLGAVLAGIRDETGSNNDAAKGNAEKEPADKRLPVPPEEEQAKATRSIVDAMKEDFRKARTGKPQVLLTRLLREARTPDLDPATRFAMLSEAETTAARAGVIDTALVAAGEKARWFAISGLACKSRVLESAARTTKTPETTSAIAAAYLALADEALAAEDLATAGRSAKLAQDWCQKAKDTGAAERAKAKSLEVAAALSRRRDLESAQETLRETPTDPAANLLVGRYLCFERGDWDRGLVCLSRCTRDLLKAAAAAELAKPTASAAMIAVGHQWLAAVPQEDDPVVQNALQQRAWYWYEQGLADQPVEMVPELAKKVNRVERWPKLTGAPMPVHLAPELSLQMIWIKPGSFVMGSPPEEPDRGAPEVRHEVRLSKGFWLARCELTQEQLYQILRGGGGGGKDARTPALMSWYDAQEVCKKLDALIGGGHFRLPTEAEWEYAARAGGTTAYTVGSSLEDLDKVAWYKANSGSVAHDVGQKTANAWGLFDMLGNADEWCQDWYEYEAYTETPQVDPTGPAKASQKVVRGGRWTDQPGKVRCASRFSSGPSSNVGVRFCLAPER